MILPTVTEMLTNLTQALPLFINLAAAIAYVGGMYMIISSIMAFRKATFLSSPGQGQICAWEVFRKIFVGAALMYLPSVINAATATFFLPRDNPMEYFAPDVVNPEMIAFYVFFKMLITLIGIMAFISGLHELSSGGFFKADDNSQHSRTVKGLIQIMGGVFCIHLPTVLQIIFATIGINL